MYGCEKPMCSCLFKPPTVSSDLPAEPISSLLLPRSIAGVDGDPREVQLVEAGATIGGKRGCSNFGSSERGCELLKDGGRRGLVDQVRREDFAARQGQLPVGE